VFAELSPPYGTIVADPPWPTGAAGSGYVSGIAQRMGSGGRRRRATRLGYTTMALADIYALPVEDLAAPNAALWLWVTAGHNRAGVGVRCAEAWGFTVVGEFVWCKPNYGLGAFPRPQHETLLVCRRGRVDFGRRNVGSVQRWRQHYTTNSGKTHSAKPDGAGDLIEARSPGPYVELFSRRPRLGWDSWGHGYEGVAS
jgi:N6-adenosine-specific RNA methylase IME4